MIIMKVSYVVLLLFGVTFGPSSGANTDQPTVVTKYGIIEGARKSIADNSYEEFLGIRFGKIPKRFRHSEVNTDTWEGVLKATSYGAKCPQAEMEGMSEDCLFINIWRPVMNDSSDPLPVLVWVHGSGYTQGSGAKNPGDIIVSTGPIIVITINYRLGAFGFAFGDPDEIPGNAGISDVITALKWVHENIGSFGGDPARVTLSGQSAGSMMSSIFPVLPIDQTLYSKLFLMSGVSVNPMFIENTTVALAKTKLLAEKVGCGPVPEGALTKQITECLQTVDASIIVEKNQDSDIMVIGGAESAAFIPVYGTQLIAQPLMDLFRSQNKTTSHKVEIVNGVAADETSYFWGESLKPQTREEAYSMAWSKLSYVKKDLTDEQMTPFFKFYFDGVVDGDAKSLRTALFNFLDDYSWRCTALTLEEVYSTKHSVHFMQFDYIIDKYGREKRPDGATHPDSTEMFFGEPFRPSTDSSGGSYSTRDAETSRRLMKKLITYVSGRDPNDWPELHFDRLNPEVKPIIRRINYVDTDDVYDKQSICIQWSKFLEFDVTKA